eukprot:scaffold50773_cov65-Phaeocystis_antarctica.AAC.1
MRYSALAPACSSASTAASCPSFTACMSGVHSRTVPSRAATGKTRSRCGRVAAPSACTAAISSRGASSGVGAGPASRRRPRMAACPRDTASSKTSESTTTPWPSRLSTLEALFLEMASRRFFVVDALMMGTVTTQSRPLTSARDLFPSREGGSIEPLQEKKRDTLFATFYLECAGRPAARRRGLGRGCSRQTSTASHRPRG